MRSISDKDQLALKAATRRAIDMAGGSDALQHMTRVKQAALAKYGSAGEDCADKYMPVDVAVEADMEAGSPIITAKMAKLLGFRLVPIEAEANAVLPVTLKDGLLIASEMADVVKVISAALEDGVVDSAERAAIVREIDEAVKALMDVMRRAGVRA